MEILASRMLIRPVDYPKSVEFYRDRIGLAIAREYGAGTVFYAGQSLIELAGHHSPSEPGVFPGALWLQVRDVYATQAELESRGVAIARAVVAGPKIMLADEPTGNLDAALSAKVLTILRQFAAHGTAVLMATHDRALMAGAPDARVFTLPSGEEDA